jgi:hypothetical protein
MLYLFRKASILLKIHLKSLAIIETASISLKKSSERIKIIMKGSNFLNKNIQFAGYVFKKSLNFSENIFKKPRNPQLYESLTFLNKTNTSL